MIEVSQASCLTRCFSLLTGAAGQRFSLSMSFEVVCERGALLDMVLALLKRTLKGTDRFARTWAQRVVNNKAHSPAIFLHDLLT